jgi:hypothetical protein
MYSLIANAKLHGIDPRAWLAGVISRIANHHGDWMNCYCGTGPIKTTETAAAA